FENLEFLEKWINNFPVKFDLKNELKFKKTQFHFQGQAIYSELSTNYYWYLDNFHKNEYEVFNKQNIHIGVADLNGKIDFQKAVIGRTLPL
ncbi:MAG: hypothetical protein RL728_1096, partial [Bacteroidota bacterium]